MKQTETIAAIATALSDSGIGIVRISGEDAIEIGNRVYKSKNGCHNLSESHLHMISLPSARISLLLDSIRFMLSIGNSFLCPPSHFCTRQCLSVRFSFSMFIHFTMFDLFFLCNFIRFTTIFLFFVLNSYILCTKLFSVFHVPKRMRTQKKRGVSPP